MNIIKNLTVYGGQPVGDVMSGQVSIIEVVNEGLIDKYKKKGAR